MKSSDFKPRLRVGTPEDISRLVEIARESFTAAQWSRTDYENLFAPKVVQDSCLLVAENAGTLIGFLAARGLDGDWEIENIVVIQDLRRRGVGTELLKGFLDHISKGRVGEDRAAENRAGQMVAKTVHLEVRDSNLAAQELYKTLGFVPVGRRNGYYSGPAEDAIVLKFSF